MLQSITDLDPEATIISIDGVGANDLNSRNAMLEGLLRMEDGDQLVPFFRCFYGKVLQLICGRTMGGTTSGPDHFRRCGSSCWVLGGGGTLPADHSQCEAPHFSGRVRVNLAKATGPRQPHDDMQGYSERFGTFGGRRVESNVAWAVAGALNCLPPMVEAAADRLSLLMVSLEQVTMDNGRWDLA